MFPVVHLNRTSNNQIKRIISCFSERAVPGSTTIAVFVSGTVGYEDSKPKVFSQNFVLSSSLAAEGKVWKVVSDCFRITT